MTSDNRTRIRRQADRSACAFPTRCRCLPCRLQVYEVLKSSLQEKDKAEEFLRSQDKMAWTIIRPGGLTNDAATGNGALTEDLSVSGRVTRDDVAAVVVKALFSKKTDGKVRPAAHTCGAELWDAGVARRWGTPAHVGRHAWSCSRVAAAVARRCCRAWTGT